MQRRSSGFTLLEVLIAISVFAVFSTMAYGGLMRLLDTRNRIEAEREFWRGTALSFTRMQQDLSNAINRPVRDSDGLPQQWAFRGQPVDGRAMADPSIEFTRGGIVIPTAETADLQRLGYRLEDRKLLRLAWPNIDRAPLTKPASTPLFYDVDEFKVRFYHDRTWHPQWPPLQSNEIPPLPQAVEITITLKGRGTYTRTFLVGSGQ